MPDSRPAGDPASVGIPPLLDHLDAVIATPTTPLETPLFEKVHTELAFYSLPFADHQQTYRTLLTHLIAALPLLPDDPAVRTVSSLIEALTSRMPVAAVLSFVPPEMLVAAMDAPHPAANLLGMDIVKRAEGLEGARTVLRVDVLSSLLTRWTQADAVEVAQRGEEALVNLLEASKPGLVDATRRLSIHDADTVNGTAGQPLTDVWEFLLEGDGGDIIRRACVPEAGSRQASLAQNRLLGLLPHVARLDLEALVASRHSGPENLLQFAIDIVDRGDIAMYLVLVQFYKDLFREVYAAPQPTAKDLLAAFIAGRRDDTTAVRAVTELSREAVVDEELAEFGTWVASVVGDTR
jgi:hypothetical protein